MTPSGQNYWRSLDELAGSPGFRNWVEREFPRLASELQSKSTRRKLLQLMAASFGLAGLTACRRPEEKILPASRTAEYRIPGKPVHYATSMNLGGCATGLIVETHEGRPTKIEGNPLHPGSLGACSALAQASVLGLYDPDRSRFPRKRGKRSSWADYAAFAEELFTPARQGRGEKLWFLSEPLSSPSLEALRADVLRRFPAARWVEFESVPFAAVNRGAELAFGQPLEAVFDFARADIILSLDCDFLGHDWRDVIPIRQFSERRRVDSPASKMNRLYSVESLFTLTGAAADHRLALPSSQVLGFARELAEELGALPRKAETKAGGAGRQRWLSVVARDLREHTGACLVVAGPRQPAPVHALAHVLNARLGNVGRTVAYLRPSSRPALAGFDELCQAIQSNAVETLVMLGVNPVYAAPAEAGFGDLLAKVAHSIHLGAEFDETADASAWHVNEAHYLESWGDTRAYDGTAALQQPMIQPLFDGKTAAEVLSFAGGQSERRSYDILRKHWLAQWPQTEGESRWRKALHDGVVEGTRYPLAAPGVPDVKRVDATARVAGTQGVEVTFFADSSSFDGRFANNGWLQETPDPMTKLTWDNAALVSPAKAQSLGVRDGDIIALTRGGNSLEIPVLIVPGQADESIAIALGYGRRQCGRVGRGVGQNANLIRSLVTPGFVSGVTISKTVRKRPLATTQEHHSMEGRPLIREATLEEYRRDPKFAHKADHYKDLFSLHKEHSYEEGPQWGMAIDLSACVGCNACVVACQAENNVPIVGREQVRRGREMHWIRVDRYYSGDPEAPRAVMQPVACQHCENAPCETVCPVAATTHSPEGLNDMAYNRCVGTRYCANNCPYKVRRFNFFDLNKGVDEIGKMVFNPDVTVRMRGVMEKCTYCVQRIQEKKIQARAEGGRPLKDGEILTACQQTCPASAIVFGDLKDPNSKVAQLKQKDRNYVMLGEINIRPRTSYLARLRNPHPELG